MSEKTIDHIVGVWHFPKNNICTFIENGEVLICGSRFGVWNDASGLERSGHRSLFGLVISSFGKIS